MAEKDYSKLDKAELIKIVEKLESRKKYGLIWDEEKVKEQFEKDAENALPVLKEIKSKEIVDNDPSKPVNFLIEGDNYHALSVLNFTHQGKIDLIYIDPPYNTENKDFKYNDSYIDKQDVYRHSKWLSFMNKRLRLASNLLKENGAIFISINEEEFAHLKILCDEIFGDANYMVNFTVKVRHEDRILKGDKDFHEVVEYLLLYRKSSEFKPLKRKRDNTSNEEYVYEVRELISKPKEVKFGNKIVQVFKPGQYEITKKESSENLLKKINIRGSIKEGNSSGRFYMRYIEPLAKDQNAYLYKAPDIGGDDRGCRYFVTPESDKQINGSYFQGIPVDRLDVKEVPYPNYMDFEEEFNSVGYEGGIEFRNGKKPLAFLQKIFEIGNLVDNKDATILDFFAGSGTTGHAVLKMNKEDAGRRSFILCTNNELNGKERELRDKGLSENEIQAHGICQYITYPRIQKVIEGYKNPKGEATDGLGGSLKYFKTKFVKKYNNGDDFKSRITNECTEMLCLREGVFEEVKKGVNYRIFKHNEKVMAVYYSLERASLPILMKELADMASEKILYCFTLDQGGFENKEFKSWDGVTVEPIPQKILEVYKQIYEY
ncbi:MAG: site-specific DNA-methyltransferase [Candidatus Taylorbacteria bacterium]|nr:site-specific DNA-methyltransferase [Candidatus Taylorbacteria bacterium]